MTSLTILGTASMMPTKERNVQAVLLEHNGEYLLFDCGEGTQRQMNIASMSRAKVRKILLTHWHGDHVGGLVSLIQTIFNSEYQHTLYIYGPKGTKERIQHLRKAVDFENKVDLKVEELEPHNEELKFYENDDYELRCINMVHSTPTIAYAFILKDKFKVSMEKAKKLGLKAGPHIGKLQRGKTVTVKGKEIKPEQICSTKRGKKFVLIPDTRENQNIPLLAESADILLSEATFANEHEEKAHQFKHLTASKAALLAQQAGAKKLILTHFSQRYTRTDKLLQEAQVHHPNVEAAFDFMKIKL